MAEYHGKDGDVILSGGYTIHLSGWTLENPLDTADASSTDDARHHHLAGLSDCNGTWNCKLDDTTILVASGTTGSAIFIGKVADVDTYYHVPVLVTNLSINAPHDGIPEVTYTWVANAGGALAIGSTTTTTTAA